MRFQVKRAGMNVWLDCSFKVFCNPKPGDSVRAVRKNVVIPHKRSTEQTSGWPREQVA